MEFEDANETQAKLAAAAEIGRALLEQNAQLQAQIATYQEQQEAFESRIRELEAKVDESGSVRVENDRLRSSAIVLEEQLAEASKLNARLQEDVKEKNNIILQMSKDSASSVDVENSPQYQELRAQMEDFSSYLSNAKTAIENLSGANARLTEEKETLEAEKSAMKARISELEVEVQKTGELKESVRFLKQKNEELANRPKENIVFGPNHPVSQLEGPLRAIFEEQGADDAASLVQRSASIADELAKAIGQVKSPSVGLLGQTLLDLIRSASNPGRKGASGSTGPQGGMHGNEASALLVVSMLGLQKLRESTAQIRKKNEEYSELAEDFQQTKATLVREQQAKPKLQQQITALSTENEEMKLKIARLEKDVEGRAPADNSAAVAEIKQLELEIDRLRLQIIDSSNKNLKQITECNEEIMRVRKKSQQLEHQLLRTEMMLAEKNAFLAEQQALIDQFNFFS
eukprot:TRINITY_DN875_c0_g1_i6.p1 TRINITY_DN875_c0_g1~~TRINITY_DN875_c0_g1_i6.p1  ORF type:complete len:460 (+),score=111.98 TRINITY_DN875_c0_g1_i6:269-1648(+)